MRHRLLSPKLWLWLLLGVIAIGTTIPTAAAEIGDTVVPLGGPTLGPLPSPPVATPAPPAAPSAAPTGPPISYTVDQTFLSKAIDNVLTKFSGVVGPLMNTSVKLGRYIYGILAGISLIMVVTTYYIDNGELRGAVSIFFSRIVEISFWFMLIGWTWTGPFGGQGWFPAILHGFASIGATISGNPAIAPQGDTFMAGIHPGFFIDIGAQTYGSIMNSLSLGNGGFLSILERSVDGTMIAQTILWLYGLFTCLYLFLGMTYVSIRYTLTIVQVYIFAPMSFLQGLNGSRRLSSMGGGFQNGALALGVEVAFTLTTLGIFLALLKTVYGMLGLGSILSNSGGGPIELDGVVMSFGALTILDVYTTAFIYFLKNAPDFAQRILSGRFGASVADVKAMMASSPLPVSKAVGWGLGVAEAGAQKGIGGAVDAAAAPVKAAVGKLAGLAAMAAVGVATGGAGLGALAVAGGRGMMMGGGIEGAGAAVAGKFFAGKFADSAAAPAEEEANTVGAGEGGGEGSGGSGGGNAGGGPDREGGSVSGRGETDGGPEVHTNRASAPGAAPAAPSSGSATQDRTVTVNTTFSEGGGGDAPTPTIDTGGSSTVTRTTVVNDQYLRSLQGASGGSSSAAGASGTSSPSGGASGSPSSSGSGDFGGGGGSGGSGGSGGGGGLGGTLGSLREDLNRNASIGRMMMYRALSMQRRDPPPPAPPPNETGPQVNIDFSRGMK